MLDPNTHLNSAASSPSEAQLRQAIEYLYYAYRSFTERPDKILDKLGLGRVHHRILYFVGRNPGTTVNALLSTLQVSKQALNAPLRQLLAMQLISAQTAPHDGRVRHLSLTRSGSKLEAQLSGTQMAQLRQAFEAAGPEARVAWELVMRRLIESDSPPDEVSQQS
jgi:DNA-binding MarR family transcriptional regulator